MLPAYRYQLGTCPVTSLLLRRGLSMPHCHSGNQPSNCSMLHQKKLVVLMLQLSNLSSYLIFFLYCLMIQPQLGASNKLVSTLRGLFNRQMLVRYDHRSEGHICILRQCFIHACTKDLPYSRKLWQNSSQNVLAIFDSAISNAILIHY